MAGLSGADPNRADPVGADPGGASLAGVEQAGQIASRPALPKALVAGIAVVLLGVVSWGLYAIAAGRENTPYHPNAAPPSSVRLVGGHTYWLAVPGGVRSVRDIGLVPSKLSCSTSENGENGAAAAPLAVVAVVAAGSDDTKFVDRIGSFAAPGSGRFHVECSGLGTVYVENAADAGFDWSGLWLVLASAALVVGLPLVLSGLRRRAQP